MRKVLIAYHHAGGTTEQMAQYIGEGGRIEGLEADVKEITGIDPAKNLSGYDGYVFGSPTYHLDVPEPMKIFLLKVQIAALEGKAELEGKQAGCFGPYTHDVGYRHDNHAPAIMLATLQNSLKMKPFDLGPLILTEAIVESPEGLKACHEYGKVFGRMLKG
jgi:multimeric flavodoxin WrbA